MADISAEITAFKNAVYGEQVRDAMVSLANKLNTRAIGANQLAASCITEIKLADNSVSSNKIQSSAVVNSKIANGSITNNKLDNNSVKSNNIASNSITSQHIQNGSITDSKLSQEPGQILSKVENNTQNKIPYPTNPNSKYGTVGQILKTNGDGSTQWVDEQLPSEELMESAISDWLDDHPEATTTVADASITKSKLTNAFNLSLSRSFDTVADMQASSELSNGMTVHTNGFTTKNDGGASYYSILNTGTADGINVISLNNGLYAHKISTIPDYIFDENSMINAINQTGNKNYNGGYIVITSPINLTNKNAVGKSFSGCIFELQSNMFTWTSSYEGLPRFINCTFIGNGYSLVNGTKYTSFSNFENCDFNSCKFCESATFVQSPHFINCRWSGNYDFITTNAIYDPVFEVCQWESGFKARIFNVRPGGSYTGVVKCRFHNCIMEGFASSTVPFITVTNNFDIIFDNCYMEVIPQLLNCESNALTNVFMSLIITNCKISFSLNVPLIYIDPSYDKTLTYSRKLFLVNYNYFDSGATNQQLFNDYTYPNMRIEQNSYGNNARFNIKNTVFSGYGGFATFEGDSRHITVRQIPAILTFSGKEGGSYSAFMVLILQVSNTVKAIDIIRNHTYPVVDNEDGSYTIDITANESTSSNGRSGFLINALKMYSNG